jgi:hypothetical protein
MSILCKCVCLLDFSLSQKAKRVKILAPIIFETKNPFWKKSSYMVAAFFRNFIRIPSMDNLNFCNITNVVPTPRTNLLRRSPLFHAVSNFSQIEHEADIFVCRASDIRKAYGAVEVSEC